jgi:chromosome partitioning protein
MKTITLLNRKGGVAKTTSTLNIAAELTARGLRVLCVDSDPQATLTHLAGYRPKGLEQEQTTLAALLPEKFEFEIAALAVEAPWGGEIWRSTRDLVGAEVALTGDVAGPNIRLQRALRQVADRYDFALVDSPPSMGKLVMNAMVAADHLLVPVVADSTSSAGLEPLFDTVNLVREYEKPDLNVIGVFGTHARRTRHSRETIEALKLAVGDLMMDAVIPLAVSVQDAQSVHEAVGQFRPNDAAALAYRELTDELLARIGLSVQTRRAA